MIGDTKPKSQEEKRLDAMGGGGEPVRIGYGLKYDETGAICIDFDTFEPIVNIAHAIIVSQNAGNS